MAALLASCDSESGRFAMDNIDLKVDSLLTEMTLYEKIGQMNQFSGGAILTGPQASTDGRRAMFKAGGVGSVLNVLGAKDTYELQRFVVDSTRLGIPLMFAYDVIHGYKTIFPIPLAESSSWNLESIEKSASISAREAASAGVNWTFNPMLDIGRDARWGRVMEGSGEDTYLAARIGAAKIRGYQGVDLASEFTIAACAKHFAGYGFAESGKDYNTVLMGPYDLHNVVLPTFKAAAETGVASFMNAFNDIDGVPATANKWLVDDLLRNTWKYEGVMVSDWATIAELTHHRVAADSSEAARLAITAGTDIDMEGQVYMNYLEEMVQSGEVDEALVDEAVRRILRMKFELGLFDDPFRYIDAEREKKTLNAPEHRTAALESARKSIVLLKNEGGLLPLNPDVRSVAIIGPLAKDKDAPIANWRGQGEANSAISFFEGMERTLDGVTINYAEGCKLSIGENWFHIPVTIEQNDRSGFTAAVEAARKSEVVFMVLGEPAYMSGEARSKVDIGLPGLQLELLQEVFKVNQNMVLILMNGRPLTIPWEAENVPAILETWHLGSMAGEAIADVVMGNYNPSGKLTMSFPRHVGQCPIYYNKRITGRPNSPFIFREHHMDVDRSPQFVFGHGLSYSTFDFSTPEVATGVRAVSVRTTVTNTGQVKGTETIQLYVEDLAASIAPARMNLKGFAQIALEPGESKEITLEVAESDLSFYDHSGQLIFEPGDFIIHLGNSSDNLKSARVTLN